MDILDEGRVNPEVLKALRAWRTQEARQQDIPPFWILSNRMLASLALHLPTTVDDLKTLPGLGKVRIEKYGQAILETVQAGLAEAPSEPSPPVPYFPPYRLVYRIPAARQAAVLQAAGIDRPCMALDVVVDL